MLIYEELSREIFGAAIDVHRQLGPGLLEGVYEMALCRELTLRQLPFQRQVPQPVTYKGVLLECGYRLDIIVEEKVILELKVVEALLPIHEAQLLTYMKLSHKRLGLLMNFNVSRMIDGIVRKVL